MPTISIWSSSADAAVDCSKSSRRTTDDDTEGTIRPQKALWDVRQALGPQDILLCGVGAHKMWVGRYYHCHEPNTCLISNGFCSMGMPLPGAIAAHLVHPDRRIFVVTGDGDFLMNVQEMETAKRLGSDITVMVWEDHDYGLITWKQQTEFGRHMDMTFGNPDWQLVGRVVRLAVRSGAALARFARGD